MININIYIYIFFSKLKHPSIHTCPDNYAAQSNFCSALSVVPIQEETIAMFAKGKATLKSFGRGQSNEPQSTIVLDWASQLATQGEFMPIARRKIVVSEFLLVFERFGKGRNELLSSMISWSPNIFWNPLTHWCNNNIRPGLRYRCMLEVAGCFWC